MRKTLLLMTVVALCAAVSQAGVISIQTTRTGTDSVDWAQLGPDNTTVPNPFTATSTGGIVVTGSFAGGGTGMTSVEGTSWIGNFSVGDALVWTNSPGQGPLTLAFSRGISQFGVQIQPDDLGDFTAQIAAYNGGTLLGTFTEAGFGSLLQDGSAIYLGVIDSSAEITSVVYSLKTAAKDPGDFAINMGSITPDAPGTGTPEPGTVMLFGGGLALLAAARRRFAAR